MDLSEYINQFKQKQFHLPYRAVPFRFRSEHTSEIIIKGLQEGRIYGRSITFVAVGLFLSGLNHEQADQFVRAMIQVVKVVPVTFDLSFVTNVAVFKPINQDKSYAYVLDVPALTTDQGKTWTFKLQSHLYYNKTVEQCISYIFNTLLDQLKYCVGNTQMFNWDFRKWGFYTIVDGKLHLEKVYWATRKTLNQLRAQAITNLRKIESGTEVVESQADTHAVIVKRLQEENQMLKRKLAEKDKPQKKRRLK